uniref:Uncharacterized protein n=1 Tax=Phytophthora ramorum TaxID=164328 RepID=H3GNL7_PHYRM
MGRELPSCIKAQDTPAARSTPSSTPSPVKTSRSQFGLQGTGNYSTVAFDGARHAETFETRTAQAHLDSIKRKTRECDSMFFDDNGGLFEQSLRLVISTGTYLVPNWGALYVFYVLPRFQFSTVLDVPGLLMDDECDEAAYELLSVMNA